MSRSSARNTEQRRAQRAQRLMPLELQKFPKVSFQVLDELIRDILARIDEESRTSFSALEISELLRKHLARSYPVPIELLYVADLKR